MDPRALLNQFMGTQNGNAAEPNEPSPSAVAGVLGAKGVMGGLAAGGVLGLLLGNKKARKTVGKFAGGAAGYGGAAVLGALAHRAYQNWQGQQSAPTQQAPSINEATAGGQPPQLSIQSASADNSTFAPPAMASDDRPFELALVKAMIAAANADGHICGEEKKQILSQMSQLQLDDEHKAFVLDALMSPPTIRDIVSLANGPEQAAEIYLASRLAIDPDDPAEHDYLGILGRQLQLPDELVAQLEDQAANNALAA